MSASPLWVSLLSPALSFLAVAVNVWITFRNWQRRPAAHWICIPVHGKEERIDFNRFLKDADDDLAKSDGKIVMTLTTAQAMENQVVIVSM